ncbi:Na+/H+ antiporter NhaA [Paraflavisolibacter sp. H34]|uniref:Na+/H+ antiporter NhaA n=1 Tax=Huijunlia imazamoxiresistens TaxID=3127457 RepID=UPI0030167867
MIRITRLFKDFTNSERSAGFVLIGTTVLSLLLTNFVLGDTLNHLYHTKIGPATESLHLRLSVEHWVNDGLMTIFFLLVGLEIEREVYIGELSTLQNASLPLFAALGGMLLPFLIHFSLNYGLPTQRGSGIPMATDIAFALGILSLAKGVPYGLKVFLTAFAIIDDLGAILVIAFFYSEGVQWGYLAAAGGILGLLFLFNRLQLHRAWMYLLPGVLLWYCFLQSGVHATLSGVLLAFVLPFGKGDESSLSYRLQHWLHKPVAFLILPLFAFVNTGIPINAAGLGELFSRNSLGIILGLVAGKPLGILLFCALAVKLGWSGLPTGVRWGHLWGAGILGGIGFTMSVFVTLLAFDRPELVTGSKMAILVASTGASLLGLAAMSGVKRRGAAHKRPLAPVEQRQQS